jgi:hypothetical protein
MAKLLVQHSQKTWGGVNVMILLIFLPKNLAKMLAYFLRLKLVFQKKNDHSTLVFFRKSHFCQKLAKIAEHCD